MLLGYVRAIVDTVHFKDYAVKTDGNEGTLCFSIEKIKMITTSFLNSQGVFLKSLGPVF